MESSCNFTAVISRGILRALQIHKTMETGGNMTSTESSKNYSRHEDAEDIKALMYIVVVLMFYAFALVILMIKYMKSEKETTKLLWYYDEFVRRERFQKHDSKKATSRKLSEAFLTLPNNGTKAQNSEDNCNDTNRLLPTMSVPAPRRLIDNLESNLQQDDSVSNGDSQSNIPTRIAHERQLLLSGGDLHQEIIRSRVEFSPQTESAHPDSQATYV